MDTSNSISFRLISIEDEKFKLDMSEKDLSSMTGDNLRFKYRTSAVINIKEDKVIVTPEICYEYGDNELFKGKASLVFSVPALASNVTYDKESRKIDVKIDIFPTLIGASFSTFRGMVHMAVKDTQLVKYPIPMIETKILVQRNGFSIIE